MKRRRRWSEKALWTGALSASLAIHVAAAAALAFAPAPGGEAPMETTIVFQSMPQMVAGEVAMPALQAPATPAGMAVAALDSATVMPADSVAMEAGPASMPQAVAGEAAMPAVQAPATPMATAVAAIDGAMVAPADVAAMETGPASMPQAVAGEASAPAVQAPATPMDMAVAAIDGATIAPVVQTPTTPMDTAAAALDSATVMPADGAAGEASRPSDSTVVGAAETRGRLDAAAGVAGEAAPATTALLAPLGAGLERIEPAQAARPAVGAGTARAVAPAADVPVGRSVGAQTTPRAVATAPAERRIVAAAPAAASAPSVSAAPAASRTASPGSAAGSGPPVAATPPSAPRLAREAVSATQAAPATAATAPTVPASREEGRAVAVAPATAPRTLAMVRPVVQPQPLPPAQSPAQAYAKLLDVIAGEKGSRCFLALASSRDEVIEVKGFATSESRVSEFDRRVGELIERPIDVRGNIVTDAQCAALAFAGGLGGYPEQSLSVELTVTEVDSGSELSGRIGNVGRERLYLVLVDDVGRVQEIGRLAAEGDGTFGFRAPMTLTGAAASTVQLILAIASDEILETVWLRNGLHASTYFRELREEILRTEGGVDFGVASFVVR